MIETLLGSNIAVVGGGRICKAILQTLSSENFRQKNFTILGVADINDQAMGLKFAKQLGIFTINDYRKLFRLKNLDSIIELTKNDDLSESIRRSMPPGIRFFDHFEARAILDYMQIEGERTSILRKIRDNQNNTEEVEELFEQFYDFFLKIAKERNEYSQTIRQELTASERAMKQIVQGSTIPSFVINKDHIVTHWNKACENLTGYPAEKIVGTNKHWKPFRSKERPIMADLVLDGSKEKDAWKYYGTKWQESALIEGAYEAEEFFPHLGENGKWLFFTAAPIKDAGGNVAGAIETLWDKTEEKQAQEDRDRHNLELTARERAMAQIIEGSTIPTFVINKNHIVTHWNKACENLTGYPAEKIVGTNKHWKPFRSKERPIMADLVLDGAREKDVWKYYGTKWQESALIEGAYEAGEFFPHLGEDGKWLFFAAAPIKDADGTVVGAIETLWDKTEEKQAQEDRDRHNLELTASERVIAQIIQGSTMPTFVINRDHIVTHWNKACENLTGIPAEKVVGTNKQWKPFRLQERPSMADLILDGITEEEALKHYGKKWQKSAMIEGAYEAEEFFPHLGEDGKWLFFTAAPIKDADGTVVGAIETLWDRTEEKQALEDRDRHNLELTESERAMAQIIQGSTIPTFVINKDHIVTHWNKACENLTGYPAEKIVGTNRQWKPFRLQERPIMADLILDGITEEETLKYYGKRWQKSALIKGAYEAEELFPHLGEDGKWLFFTGAPIKDADGAVVGAIETLWDKTEEKQAQEDRERYTMELATLCSIYAALNAPLDLRDRINEAIRETSDTLSVDGICIFLKGDDGKYHMRYNYGYSDELCQKETLADGHSMISRIAQNGRFTIFENIDPSDHEEFELLKEEGYRSLAYVSISVKGDKGFGVVRAASREPAHFANEEKHVVELLANRIGVAIENNMLQEALQRDAEFQVRLIESSLDGIVATDDKWRIVTFNPGAERIFGYSSSEVIREMDARTIYPPEITETIAEKSDFQDMNGELPWIETSIVSKNGENIPVRFSGTLLHEDGMVIGSVAFFQDLRKIKQLEKELLRSERLAAVGQTVAFMAHEIKNILHGFKGGSHILKSGLDRNDSTKLKTGWQMMQRNIDRISELALDLLSYSKEREPEYESCSPNEIAGEVCELFAGLADEHDIELKNEFGSIIGEVVMDPRTIHRALSNLVSNAIDACIADEDSDKQHRVSVTTDLENGNMVKFGVKDNGSGMNENVKANLFKSFFSTKGAKGTGLGLLVTKKLIEEHQGTIDVASQFGKETTFSIRLPFEAVSAD